MINLVERAYQFSSNTAVISNGESFTYKKLLADSNEIASSLLLKDADLNSARIAFMVDPGYDYVKLQWGIWRAGGIAVPLFPGNPNEHCKYILEDTNASVLIISEPYLERFTELCHELHIQLVTVNELVNQSTSNGNLPNVDPSTRAMILYTSGTTGKPKGVVTTHLNIESQVTSLVEAWKWSDKDHILNILPMHHVHGIINVLSCALWSGAICEFLPKFGEKEVFHAFKRAEVNIFMAVPTIYYKLINYWDSLSEEEKEEITGLLSNFRLMVSGSAALPVSVMEKWELISKHKLLERYGMTEIGMAISNPYQGNRRPGHIGQPLPNVEVQLVDDRYNQVQEGDQGEILVKGPGVFKEYWGKEEETTNSFIKGWFKTGDIAIYNSDSYRIVGRASIDIIKTGGYKVSALEIEEVLRTHHSIRDCGVVGVDDEEWGEVVCVAIIKKDTNEPLDGKEIREFAAASLPAYKLPRKFIFLDDLPRNAMGKVTKNKLKELF